MNCLETRAYLPALLYGDLQPEEKRSLEKHLAGCSECQREYAALGSVKRLLGATAAPEIRIDLPRLYQRAAQRQERRLRWWRRASAGCAAAAAVLALLALSLRLEARLEGHQLVLRWGSPPPLAEPSGPLAQVDPAPAPPPRLDVIPVTNDQQLKLMSELIRALADRLQDLESRQQQDGVRVETRFQTLQDQNSQRWTALDRTLRALYVLVQKGE